MRFDPSQEARAPIESLTADVFTFHGYCKHLMRSHSCAGLATDDYHRPVLALVVGDVLIVGGRTMTIEEINDNPTLITSSEVVVDRRERILVPPQVWRNSVAR